MNARPPDESAGKGGHGMPVQWTKEGGRSTTVRSGSDGIAEKGKMRKMALLGCDGIAAYRTKMAF